MEYEENNDIGNLTKIERREFQQWISKALEQESRWIPISERLPEEKQMVWVKSNDMYLKKINPCIGWRNGFYWRTYTANGVHIIQYPIAWKSYKLESEE